MKHTFTLKIPEGTYDWFWYWQGWSRLLYIKFFHPEHVSIQILAFSSEHHILNMLAFSLKHS